MNFTELFLIQMGISYAQMVIQTNTKLTPAQKTALEQFIADGQAVALAFGTSA